MTSQKIDVLITLPTPEASLHRLKGVSDRLRVACHPTRLAEDIPAEIWQRTEILFTERTLPTPEQAPALKWVQFNYAGIDRWLNTPILSRPGMQVTTMSGVGAPKVAEHIVGMLLALGNKLPALGASQRKNEWLPNSWEIFQSRELRGQTVGIVGYGSIGRQVARLLHAFGAEALACKRDPRQPNDIGYTLPETGDANGDYIKRLYPYQALRSMLKQCDSLVVCVPLTNETRGLVNVAALEALRPGAFIVDVSRGGVIDQVALQKLLKEGHIAGAALDVFPEEPLPPTSPLWNTPNVIITPHIADSSPQFHPRALDFFSENLHRYLAGLPLYNIYDPQRGY